MKTTLPPLLTRALGRIVPFLLTLCALAFALPAVHAAPGDVDPLDAAVVGNFVYASAVQPDGKTIIAGNFTSLLGQPLNNIARLNADGTLDAGFNPDANGTVWSVAVQADGRILLGGDFTTVGGTARNFIARVDTAGVLDAGFDPNANSSVRSVAVQADGRILLGGTAFTSVGGITRRSIARVDATGVLDAGFNPNVFGSVNSVAVQADGRILLGGGFIAVGGILRNYIARVDAAGVLDASFTPNANNQINSVAVQADGRILLGGEFTTVGGTARNYIARVDAAGVLDAGFNPNANNTVFSVAVQADDRILLGGSFTTVGGTGRNCIARVDAAGALDAGFDPNANSTVRSVAVQADGRILLGGHFNTMGGTARNKFARLLNDPATQILSAPDATQVTWTRGGSSPEVSQVTFEQSTDGGATWTALGNGTRIGTTPNWQLTGLALPASGEVRARGRTMGGYANGSSGLVEAVAPFTFAAPEITVLRHAGPELVDGADTVDFGLPTSPQVVERQFTVRNTGNADLTGLGITFSGDVAGEFSVAIMPTVPVAGPAGSTIFSVQFRPTVAGGFAPRNVVLHLASNDADENAFDIALTGTGLEDTVPPETTITSTQPSPTSATTATITFTGSDNATPAGELGFDGRLDGAAFAPVSSPVVLSGLADGAHTYEVRARDVFNNVDATAASVSWVVDTTPPETTITGGPADGSVSGPGVSFAFSADESASFWVSLDGSVFFATSPLPLSELAAGSHTFSVAAVDALGNVDATPATRTWTVVLDPVTAVAFHGATAGATPSPGDAVPGEPVGTTFKTFGIPALNDAGTVAFLTTMTTPTGSVAAVFDGTAVVARKAGATPISGTTFAGFKDPALNSQGEVAFTATLAGSVATLDKTALFTNDGGTLATVVRTDDALPGLGGARLKTITAFQLLDDAVIFSGLLQSKTGLVAPGPGGATTADDSILCRWTATGGVELLLREGASLGGKTVKTISTLLPASGSTGHGRKGNPNTNGLARVAFSDGTQALMEIDPAGGNLLAETGGTLTNPAGAQWKTFGLPATSYSGGAAFLATLATGPGGVTSVNATGLFADTNAGSNEPVARKGDTVGGFTLTAFKDPVFNDDSAVASLVSLGGAVTSATNKAILLVPNGGAATLIAQTGGEPAGVTGAQWKSFTSLALPDGLGTVFTAKMVTGLSGAAGPGGVITATDTGLWAQDSIGALHLIAREGVTVIDGKTLKSFTVLGAVGGSPGQTRAFNASKQLVYRATYTDGSQSLVQVLVP